MQNNRWYDKEPTLSLAISLIKSSKQEVQLECARIIKQKAQDFGVVLNNNLLGAFNYVLNRWYDSNEPLSESMDYLKEADDDTRKQIALEIIHFLQEIKVC